ncbi:hypothetical protein J4Q44_G00290930 [Coregonus suidteri]|uniref:Uncharacterized protein n=1 Tax=Coregonus suidteri TaxID=861788 RepID=A0AAN8QDW9_9TELE
MPKPRPVIQRGVLLRSHWLAFVGSRQLLPHSLLRDMDEHTPLRDSDLPRVGNPLGTNIIFVHLWRDLLRETTPLLN